MIDLWDWADVAAFSVVSQYYRRGLRSFLTFDPTAMASAIRYGYERAQQDSNNGVTCEKVTHPQAAEVAPQSAAASSPVAPEFDWDRYFPLKTQPTVAQDVPPVAASEFPRVWVAWVSNSDGSKTPVIGKTSRHEYIHLSELERLREAARNLCDCIKSGKSIYYAYAALEQILGGEL